MKAADELGEKQKRARNGCEQAGTRRRLKICCRRTKKFETESVSLAPWSPVSANKTCARVEKVCKPLTVHKNV